MQYCKKITVLTVRPDAQSLAAEEACIYMLS
jgi:hypothetical protein